MACLRTDPVRPFFAAGFFAFRVKPFPDFVTAFRFGVDFFAAALAGARLFAADIFTFVPRLVGWLLARLFRAAITAPDTAPINVPTTGVPTAVPTTAPATAPPRVLLAAPLSSLVLSLSSLMISPCASRASARQSGCGHRRFEKCHAALARAFGVVQCAVCIAIHAIEICPRAVLHGNPDRYAEFGTSRLV